ncbi:hypothetical protein GGS21DRAFT_137471 [Xylaria nigripes]|nr:hypothetical protein GGS21DRAFT_137471 [Xylaria nigripes]
MRGQIYGCYQHIRPDRSSAAGYADTDFLTLFCFACCIFVERNGYGRVGAEEHLVTHPHKHRFSFLIFHPGSIRGTGLVSIEKKYGDLRVYWCQVVFQSDTILMMGVQGTASKWNRPVSGRRWHGVHTQAESTSGLLVHVKCVYIWDAGNVRCIRSTLKAKQSIERLKIGTDYGKVGR